LALAGGFVSLLAVGWILWRVDFDRLQEVVAQANVGYLLLVPIAVAAEQLVRGWKWRQLLYQLRPIGTLRLFGAIMAGYFANSLVPLGISPLVRSWVVARLESLSVATVLATAAIDRFVDGIVFAHFVAFVLIFAAFPDPTGALRLGLTVGGLGSLAVFALLLFGLARYKRSAARPGHWLTRLAKRLPGGLGAASEGLLRSFSQGIVWPREPRRGLAIVLASFVIKLIATTHFLWAGLAFGIVLRPAEYVFLVVFLGFLIILTRFVRIPGGFFFGGVFALDLIGVAQEPALAMVLVVQISTVIAVTGIGAVALWRFGISFGDLRGSKDVPLERT